MSFGSFRGFRIPILARCPWAVKSGAALPGAVPPW
jgi:hypothetical protein